MRCWRPEIARGPRLSALFAIAAGLLLAGGLLAGCGNEREDFREKQLNPLVRRAGAERSVLASVLRVSRPRRARDAAALREQLGSLAGVFRRIAALSPPEGVEARFERYVRANAVLLRALRRFVSAFARGDEAAQERIGDEARRAVARATRAQRELQRSLR